MTDKQEIIETLYKIEGFFSGCRDNAHEGSKFKALYQGYMDAAKGAAELLKKQEPRVMDADEIVQSADPSKWLWVERKGDYCAEAFKAGKTISGLIAFDSETPGAFLYCERPDDYGKTWRCWSARPTDEQRKAVKWDA